MSYGTSVILTKHKGLEFCLTRRVRHKKYFIYFFVFFSLKNRHGATTREDVGWGWCILPGKGHLSGDLLQLQQGWRSARMDAGQYSVGNMDRTVQAHSVVLVQRRQSLLHKLAGWRTRLVAGERVVCDSFCQNGQMEVRRMQPDSPFLLLRWCGFLFCVIAYLSQWSSHSVPELQHDCVCVI